MPNRFVSHTSRDTNPHRPKAVIPEPEEANPSEGKYPAFRYHEKHPPRIIKSDDEHAKLEGEGWKESPADLPGARHSAPSQEQRDEYEEEDAKAAIAVGEDPDDPEAPAKKKAKSARR